MKNARLLFALILVGSAVACSAVEPTGPLPESQRSVYMGGGNGTPTDSTTQRPDSTSNR